MLVIRTIELCAERLAYRAEGNSSVVVAVDGVDSSSFVLRLLKAVTSGDTRDTLAAQLAFSAAVVPLLLPHPLVATPSLVLLSAEQVDAIQRLLRDKRPRHRLDKQIAAAGDTYALLLPDYCRLPAHVRHTCGPVLCVEIKPKQGFLPDACALPPQLAVKARVCRYGLAQFHKLQKGSICALSHYCPLDLFSGCPRRMRAAVSALASAPQNNFRVFRDSQLVIGDGLSASLSAVVDNFCRSAAVFCDLVVQALTRPLARPTAATARHRPQFCALHPRLCARTDHSLPVGSVLESVLSAQALDSIDSSVANDMLDAMTTTNNNHEMDCAHVPDAFAARERLSHESADDYCARKVWQFLVSLTAKDCSLMLTMQRTSDSAALEPALDETRVRDPVTGQQYALRVAVIDLDAKRAYKIRRTLSNDLRMARAYASVV